MLPLTCVAFDDYEFNCMPKKFEKDTKTKKVSHGQFSQDQWGYDVTLGNKTFKDMTDLEIKYIMFYKQVQFGSKAAPTLRRKAGKTMVSLIKSHDKATFQTDVVELEKASLEANYVFRNGGKPKVQDALSGLWIRVYKNGSQVAEFSRPTDLSSKERWQ